MLFPKTYSNVGLKFVHLHLISHFVGTWTLSSGTGQAEADHSLVCNAEV